MDALIRRGGLPAVGRLLAVAILGIGAWFPVVPAGALEEEGKEDDSKPAGEIREPKEGESVDREFTVKGRTRGAPRDYAAMLFRGEAKAEELFPHYEFSPANRTFSTYVYHGESEGGEWEVHLYILPEEDAEKLVAWVKKAGELSEAGKAGEIKPFDPALTAKAVRIDSRKYYLKVK